MLFLFQLFGPSPPITISKQTTYITDPLLPSGIPNYEEYIRRKLREGVTRENNAAVLLFEALWPSELKPDQYEAVATELGLNDVPSAESAMKSVHGKANRKRIADWLPKPARTTMDARNRTPCRRRRRSRARRRARTSVDQPAVAAAGRVGRGE